MQSPPTRSCEVFSCHTMARTKQTARKSCAGKAPRKQLACKTAKAFKGWMTSQQQKGPVADADAPNKTSYINYENTLRSFSFKAEAREHERDFAVRYATARTTDPFLGVPEQWLGVSFLSRFVGAVPARFGCLDSEEEQAAMNF